MKRRAPKRRLAIVIHHLNPWGGQEKSVLEIARRLSHRWGIDLCSFTWQDPAGESAWGDVRFRPIRPWLPHPFILNSSLFQGLTVPALRALPRLRGERAPLVHATGACSLVSDVVQLQFVQAAWKVARDRIRARDPGLVRAPRAREAGPMGWAVEAYQDAVLRYNIGTERIAFRPEKTYIAIARSVAAEASRHYGLAENVHVVHHGVDPEAFRPAGSDRAGQEGRAALRAKLGIGPDDRLIAFAGAYERKGLAVAIRALSRLEPGLRDRARLLALGSGEPGPFAELAKREGVAGNVILQGHTRDIAAYYRASDLFLLPTLYEPFGMVILEAMASGLFPVVSRLAGASELIEHGKSGLLIDDPSDPSETASRLSEALREARFLEQGRREARRVAEARSWDQVAIEYERILEPLMERA